MPRLKACPHRITRSAGKLPVFRTASHRPETRTGDMWGPGLLAAVCGLAGLATGHNLHCLEQPAYAKPLMGHLEKEVELRCLPGYRPSSSLVRCLPDHSFQPAPVCTPIQAQTKVATETSAHPFHCLYQPVHGRPVMGHAEMVISVECDEDFAPVRAEVKCTDQGFQPLPLCKRDWPFKNPPYPSPPPPLEQKRFPLHYHCRETPAGAVFEMRAAFDARSGLTCGLGRQPSEALYRCTERGFRPRPRCVPKTAPVCRASPAHGLALKARSPDSAFLFCGPGFLPRHGEYRCHSSGRWLPDAPLCDPAASVPAFRDGCLARPAHGQLLRAQTWHSARLRCLPGYAPRQSQPSLCLIGGVFFPRPHCDPLPTRPPTTTPTTTPTSATTTSRPPTTTKTRVATEAPTTAAEPSASSVGPASGGGAGAQCRATVAGALGQPLSAAHGLWATLQCEKGAEESVHRCLDGVFHPVAECRRCGREEGLKTLVLQAAAGPGQPGMVRKPEWFFLRACRRRGDLCRQLAGARLSVATTEVFLANVGWADLCGPKTGALEVALVERKHTEPQALPYHPIAKVDCGAAELRHNRRRIVAAVRLHGNLYNLWLRDTCPL